MHISRIAIGLALTGALQGCVGVYHVSGTSGNPDDGIYRLHDPNWLGIAPTSFIHQAGRDPHVAADGALFYAKPVAAGVYQIHRNGVQVTTSPGSKRNPAYSNGWLAYEIDDASSPTGKRIGLKQMPSGPESVLPYVVSGGLDFFDGGQKLVFVRREGVYWGNVSPASAETQIRACPSLPTSGCSGPVVSHDGSRMGFILRIGLASGTASEILILDTATWNQVTAISHSTLCPTCTGPGRVYEFGSFDFSPDDQWLYVTAVTQGANPPPPPPTRELYRIKIDATSPERLTNNDVHEFHPSTKRCYVVWFGC